VSIATAVARIQELQHMLAAPAPAPVAAPAGTQTFASTLAGATAGATTPPLASASAVPTAAAPGATPASGSVAGVPYADEINAAAQRNGIDPALLTGLIRAESNFNAGAVSPAGARGLTQLMPGTAASLGVDASIPAQAIEGGARYLKQQLDRFGSPDLALAAYNAGPGAVQRYGGVPPYAETQAYVTRVREYAAQYRQAPAAHAAAVGPALVPPVAAAVPAAAGLTYSTT
jgi:soluble lytic murein transglycosylase-like protein